MDTADILDRLERASSELHAASRAAIDLVRIQSKEMAARIGPDDEWTRLPGDKCPCKISGWSRSKLKRLIASGQVRKKRATGSTFYSGADVRRLIDGDSSSVA